MIKKRITFTMDLDIPQDFGYWFSGFVDGEGHFQLLAYIKNEKRIFNASFQVNLRADDKRILEYTKDILTIGDITINNCNNHNLNPMCRYRVGRLRHLVHAIIPLLEKYPLRTRKKDDFEIWKEAVLLRYPQGTKTMSDDTWGRLLQLSKTIKDVRKYRN